jgi:hypothetical protein
MDATSGESDEELREPAPSFVVSSELRSQLEALTAVAKKRFREQNEDSITESSKPQEASELLVVKKQKVGPTEEGDQDEDESLPRRSEQESVKTLEDEATPDPVSVTKDLKVADQEQERVKESLSDQNRQESSPSKEKTASTNGVSDAMDFTTKVANQEHEQKRKSYSEQRGLDVLMCNELQEGDLFWQENGHGRSQSSEASRTSDVSARDADQEAESSSEPSEQEPSPSSEAGEAISVLAALKDPSREEEEEESQKEEFEFSKRKPKAKQFFDHDIDTDDDENAKRKTKTNRHFDSFDTDYEENERKSSKNKPPEDFTNASFPEQIYKMVTETAATQPELIDWVHDGEAFTIFEPVSKHVVTCIVVP